MTYISSFQGFSKGLSALAYLLLIGCGSATDNQDSPLSDPNDTPPVVSEAPKINDTMYDDVCLQDETPEYTGESAFTISPILATYYTEKDNFDTGVGTNGSDPSIIPELVFQETVSATAISYPFDHFRGIDADKLYLTWEGEINVESETANILANFSSGHSDITFYVDGEVVKRMKNCKLQVPLVLSKGLHSFKVEYHNHWHTAGLNLIFVDRLVLPIEDARVALAEVVSADDEVVYIYSYTSDNFDLSIPVTLPDSGKGLIVIFNSYNAINWEIVNSDDVTIKAIILNQRTNSSSVDFDGKQIVINNMGTKPADAGETVREIVGRGIDYAHEEYSSTEVTLTTGDKPSEELDLGNQVVLINNLQSISMETTIAESKAGGQLIASFMPLNFSSLVAKIKWTTWSNIVIESCGSLCERLIPQEFKIVVYSGDFFPEEEVFSETVTVEPKHKYSTESGNIYIAETEFATPINLVAGNYWISIQYISNENGVDYRSVIESDGSNIGGAFSTDDGVTWGATTLNTSPVYSAGVSLFVEGYINQP